MFREITVAYFFALQCACACRQYHSNRRKPLLSFLRVTHANWRRVSSELIGEPPLWSSTRKHSAEKNTRSRLISFSKIDIM
jgi:hypothetical protein